jgi:hypothetical protein
MTLDGYLSEYSLPEVFNFVHQGNQSGLLSISKSSVPAEQLINPHYLWFQAGRIIAVSTGTDGQGLLNAISHRKLVPDEQIEQLRTQVQKLQQPLGLHLKSRGLLPAEQLKLLFNSQVIAVVSKLFELNNGRFHFDPSILAENAEMTGISMPVQEITLLGLRSLRDWASLSNKLPDTQYAIQRLSLEEPGFMFNQNELNLWKLADGETPLEELNTPMNMSIEAVQKTAYRLIIFGLVQEVAVDRSPQPIDLEMALPELVPIQAAKNTVSTSFLGNLMGFLKRKG